MPPGKPEVHDTEQSQAIADATRLIQAGIRTDDSETQAAGAARLIKAVGTNISPDEARALGLDKIARSED